MVDTKLKGVMPALMTAFADEEHINKEKVAELVRKLVASKVDGLYVGGSSGEMILCSLEERMELLETVMQEKGNTTIIAHVGAMSTEASIKLAKHSKKVGADAVSSVTPFYYKYNFASVKNYYKHICDASEMPMIIYNLPALTGSSYGFDQLAELLNIDGVAGMKFTSSDFFLLNRLKTAFPDKVFYNGSDEMFMSGLVAGADGGIGTTYNFMPELFVNIYRLFNENKITEARKLQTLANAVIAEVIARETLPASKQMIVFGGVEYGICREPFLPLDEATKAELYEKAWLRLQDGKKEYKDLIL